jgi:cytidyltransferase-like protein
MERQATFVEPGRLVDLVKDERKDGNSIVLTGGTFYIVDEGHIDYLTRAKAEGDILVVNITTDKRISKYKELYSTTDPEDMVRNEINRAKVVSELKPVDYVTVFPYDHPGATTFRLSKKIKPEVMVRETWPRDLREEVREKLGYSVKLKSIKPQEGQERIRTRHIIHGLVKQYISAGFLL